MLYRWTSAGCLVAAPLLDVGGGAQDVEPLQDHADGAQLAVHPLQSPLQRHLVDETQPLNTPALRFVDLAKALNDAGVREPSARLRLALRSLAPTCGPHGSILQCFSTFLSHIFFT